MKKWRISFILLLVLVMLFTAACGSQEQDQQKDATDSATKPGTSAQTTQPAPTAAVQLRDYPDNILMSPSSVDNDKEAVFGNGAYVPNDVKTVTFLDTLDGMPEDAWDVSADGNGSVMAWMENGCDLYIAGEGGVTANPDSRFMFQRYEEVVSIEFNDCFYTDLVENLAGFFYECFKLETLDLSFWNTASVKKMHAAFQGCVSLREIDLSSFDTSGVTNMSDLFARCRSLTTIDLSNFETGNVEDFGGMFTNCENLTQLDISHFDTSNADDIAGLFSGCESLTELDLSNFDTSNVTDMAALFNGCEKLEKLDISSFETAKVTRFTNMFRYCAALKELDLSHFKFDSATITKGMFQESGITDIGCTITLPDGCDAQDMYKDSHLG